MNERLFIGLMSGTSIDGIDAGLVDLSRPAPRLLAGIHHALPRELRQRLLDCARGGALTPLQMARLDHDFGQQLAIAAEQLLDEAGVASTAVEAIGSHGQTILHQPSEALTWQLGAPAVVATRTGIPTVSDFRSLDLSLGGEGAPLAPLFHQVALGSSARARAVVNLGGIANVTLLEPDAALRGFDTGPANILMDAWVQRTTGALFDVDGEGAARGKVIEALLQALLAHPYYAAAPPKSTGRELFDLGAVDQALARLASAAGPDGDDVLSTLCELTVRTVLDALRAHAPRVTELLVCGGGARNPELMRRLRASFAGAVRTTDEAGVPGRWMEVMAFAWLAQQHLDRRPIDTTDLTGASRPHVPGCLYQP